MVGRAQGQKPQTCVASLSWLCILSQPLDHSWSQWHPLKEIGGMTPEQCTTRVALARENKASKHFSEVGNKWDC